MLLSVLVVSGNGLLQLSSKKTIKRNEVYVGQLVKLHPYGADILIA